MQRTSRATIRRRLHLPPLSHRELAIDLAMLAAVALVIGAALFGR